MAERKRRKTKPNVEAKESVIRVIRTEQVFPGGDPGQGEREDIRKETVDVDVHEFVSEPAYIRVGAGTTRNMGNYESLRVDIAITMPCYPNEIDRVYPQVSDKVYDLLDEEVSMYLGSDEEGDD